MTQATKRVPAENIEHGIQRTRWLLTCAALLAFVLCGTAAAHAQSSRSLSGATPPATANRSAASPGPRTAEQSPASGMNTGIKVHGHWTIDVLNPDGSLVKHVEFENALTLVGAETLPLILGRAATPGAWAIGLGYGAAGPDTGPGPCNQQTASTFTAYGPNHGFVAAGWTFYNVTGACYIAEDINSGGSPAGYPVACGSGYCFPSLNVSVVTAATSVVHYTGLFNNSVYSAPQNQLQLQGIATAQNDGSIDTVATFLMLCSIPTGSSAISPSTCATGPLTTSTASNSNFGTLGGSGSAFEQLGQGSPSFGNSITAAFLTGSSATSTPPAPIGVLATQVLRVTVLLSFS